MHNQLVNTLKEAFYDISGGISDGREQIILQMLVFHTKLAFPKVSQLSNS